MQTRIKTPEFPEKFDRFIPLNTKSKDFNYKGCETWVYH